MRQINVGTSYFMDKFSVRPTTAINFDPFGHTRGLVQILTKTGYDSYVMMRGHMQFGDFIWKGFDDSEVLCHRIYGWYNTPKGKAVEKIEQYLSENYDTENNLLLWGVGNHGGGASKVDIENINRLMQEKTEEKLIQSNLESYFSTVDKTKLPQIEKSLVHCFVGCYTAMVRLKKKYRFEENKLY